MKKKNKYLLALASIVILRVLDLYTTFIYTPQLKYEWNPLVRIFGFTWGGVIASQVILVLLIAALMYFYFERKPVKGLPKNLSFIDFMDRYFGEKRNGWLTRVFGIPKNLKKVLVFNGFVFMALAIGVSAFAILNNLLIISSVPAYLDFMAQFQNIFYPCVFLAAGLFSFRLFFMIEYRSYEAGIC